MLFIENVKLALSAIRSNKMRSFLTMLGIIIGISSVIAITSIGDSAKGAVSKEFEGYGAGYMYIMLNWQVTGDYVESGDFLTLDDMEALKTRFGDDLLYIAPSAYAESKTKLGSNTANLSLNGVEADYNQFSKNVNVIHGRMINKNDVDGARDNVVVDVKAARYLFGKENIVGKTIPVVIGDEPKDLNVVGVYEIPPSIFTAMNTGSNYTCFVPYTSVTGKDFSSSYFEIYANPDKNVSQQGNAFADYLSRIKGKDTGYYMYETAESQLGMINTVLGTLSIAIGAIAAISLLVGGIGIMNIMLVSVTERTREIGIRKSLGARTRDILTQFLIEAMILSIIGGLIGTTFGVAIATIGTKIAGVDVVISPIAILLAVVFSAGVGIFFGIFPAKKAAKLDPIEALRYE